MRISTFYLFLLANVQTDSSIHINIILVDAPHRRRLDYLHGIRKKPTSRWA